MALVRLMSRAIGHLAALAAESSAVGSSVLPRDGASIAVVADETPYRSFDAAYQKGLTSLGGEGA
jgi:hypothetical protein